MNEVSKSQAVRLIDVLVLGPFMIYWGYRGKLSTLGRAGLIVSGALTIGYNLKNYLANQRESLNLSK